MRALNGWAALGFMACAASTFAASVTVEGVFRSQIGALAAATTRRLRSRQASS